MSWDKLTNTKKEGGLGFRYLKAFNMAMVAKQGWNLISKPHTLVSKNFKARYYPNTSFFDANIGFNPSFVWRSLWKAREVLMLGCRWSIGDGSQIMAMNEPWLRGRREGCLIGPQKQAYEDILQVPLLKEVVKDRLIWKEEQNGVYSVCSGYRLWRSLEDRKVAGRFAVVMNVIWKNKNDLIWHNEKEEASKLGLIAFHNWHDWFMAQRNQERNENLQNVTSWNPPPKGWLKCNVDARFNKQWGTTNGGWCVRDKSGNFVVAGVAWDIGTLSILEAEASAIKEAIESAIALHLENVIFESDARHVVQAIHSNHKGDSEFSLIIMYIRNLLHISSNFEVKFVKRQVNSVAHSLVKVANSWSRCSVTNVNPPCIQSIILNEMR
ncbi:uncharacterized protein LOC131604778 [Vicia villosa]|uniref:uncharacterized protein LOC131604778 n=1 Tax=Vicia villosa TaxID=3911 RepID=UPI00273CA2F6|nr:uncharacterized protein LOC131604778 [Vicia villosa]